MGLFDDSIGPFIIGNTLACFLTGITTAQAFQYYQNFPNDRRLYKCLVLGLFLFDLAYTAINIVTLWDWCVENYGDFQHLANAPWSFGVNPTMIGLMTFTCQTFYAYRVYVMGKRNLILPVIILLLSFVSLSFAVAATYKIFELESFARFREFTYGAAIWLGVAAACDVLITSSLVYFLRKSKTGMERTSSILNRIIELTVSTNAITTTLAILGAILFSTMNNSAHVAPNLLLPKCYFNSLLVSLNARVSFERRLNTSHGDESHGLAEFSIAGHTPGGKIKSQRFARPIPGGGIDGIQVTTHRSVITDGALDSSTYVPSSETISEKELPFYSNDKEEAEARRDYDAHVHPFTSGGRSTLSPEGTV